MEPNEAKQQQGNEQVPGESSTRRRANLRLAPKIGNRRVDPERGTVVSLVRKAIGPVLDTLNGTTATIGEAKRLREIARSVGDDEVEAILTQELNRIADAARVRH